MCLVQKRILTSVTAVTWFDASTNDHAADAAPAPGIMIVPGLACVIQHFRFRLSHYLPHSEIPHFTQVPTVAVAVYL